MIPTVEEAKLDLTNVRAELEVMRRISVDANWLSGRDDVDSDFYKNVARKVNLHISRGSNLEQTILSKYPELL